MAVVHHFCNWSFDVGSLLDLLGEQEEVNYRLMNRSLYQCLAAVPVAGLQSYMRSHKNIIHHNASVPLVYRSPYGCKTADLTDYKLHHIIAVRELLDDSKVLIYHVSGDGHENRLGSPCLKLMSWIILSRIVSGLILWWTAVFVSRGLCSWVRMSNCVVHVASSTAVQSIDRH